MALKVHDSTLYPVLLGLCYISWTERSLVEFRVGLGNQHTSNQRVGNIPIASEAVRDENGGFTFTDVRLLSHSVCKLILL